MKVNGVIVERPQHMWIRVSLSIHHNNISKAKKILGWSPVHTNIDDIVKSAFDWHACGEQFSSQP